MNPREAILHLIGGEVIHSTSAAKFKAILESGEIRPGLNCNPGGFCQCQGGISQHTKQPCLSLSDLSLSSRESLLSSERHWYCQLTTPTGAQTNDNWHHEEYAEAVPSLVLHREYLQEARCYSYARIKTDLPNLVRRSGSLVKGRFIEETEICYDGAIPVSAIKKILLVCSFELSTHELLPWTTPETVLVRLDEFSMRVRKAHPPKVHFGPIRPSGV